MEEIVVNNESSINVISNIRNKDRCASNGLLAFRIGPFVAHCHS